MGAVEIVKLERIMGIITRRYGRFGGYRREMSEYENARARPMRRSHVCTRSGVLNVRTAGCVWRSRD